MIKRNIKIVVTPEESKQVQEICFANGIGWSGKDFRLILLDKEYLMIRDGITWDDKKRFCELNLEEISAELFIRTNGTCIEETPEQKLKQNNSKEETMEKNEVKSYADVKEYLIAKGLYERVLEIDWDYVEVKPKRFIDLFSWDNVEEGFDFWDNLDDELRALDICDRIESLVQDYKAKQGKEFIEHLETQPKEVVETKPAPTSYINVKEYLIAKGLYEDVLSFDIDFNGHSPNFVNLFYFDETPQGIEFWNKINSELKELRISSKINEILEDYEVRKLEVVETKPKPTSYADVKEYLIAKGLYERVLGLIEGTYQPNPKAFSDLFQWSKTPEGVKYWDNLDNDLIKLKINKKIESLVQDYKAKQCVEAQPTQKPKQYLCYIQGKALPKHIHKTLEQAKQEAQRLCRKELAKVSVLEVVAEYEAEVLVKEVL